VSDVRFSVVVPAYETREAHLTALLDSLYAQTYPDWELVIADASADGRVGNVLERWGRAHSVAIQRENEQDMPDGKWHPRLIRYCKLKKNEGIANNTNVGIGRAAGEYIGLLDHDDLLTPDALFEMARAIEEGKNSGERPKVLYSDED